VTKMSESASQPVTNGHTAALEAIDTLDDTLNQKARMKIMTTLLAFGEADFKLLKDELALSDGNLSTHLALLEERGYIEARKEFVRRKPHSSYRPTETGRAAFQQYLEGLMRIVRAASPPNQREAVGALPEATDTGKPTGRKDTPAIAPAQS